jgi:hypothetical protein
MVYLKVKLDNVSNKKNNLNALLFLFFFHIEVSDSDVSFSTKELSSLHLKSIPGQ